MTWYLQLNLSLMAFGGFVFLILKLPLSARQRLKAHLLLVVFALLAVAANQLLPEEGYQYPQREVIEAPMQMATHGVTTLHQSLSQSRLQSVYSARTFSMGLFGIMAFAMCLLLWKILQTCRSLWNTHLYKRVGHLEILISENLQSPYAFSFLNRSFVVLPGFLLAQPGQFRMAALHELQHLRNKDTLWVYVFEFLTTICFLNPVVWLWKSRFALDQEFACDEALIKSKKVLPREYASCLFEVAETTNAHNIPFGATGMAWGKQQPQLLRRIVQMKHIKEEAASVYKIMLGFILVFFAASVLALQSPKPGITLGELEKIANPSDFNEFPIEINEQVVTELNRFLSNSKWRKFTRESLERYKGYKTLIDKKADRYQMPREIAAVAFIESGFQNLPDRSTSISSKGAGMWQFIPQTARNYGLVVNQERDERLHITKATDAAIRYLASNRALLSDLRLALMGYYVGEGRVQQDIEKYGTRDPWELMKQGSYKTPYLARAMAAAIILKYPSLLD